MSLENDFADELRGDEMKIIQGRDPWTVAAVLLNVLVTVVGVASVSAKNDQRMMTAERAIGGTGLVLLDVLRNRLIRARAFHGGTLFQNRGGVVYQLIGDLQRNRKARLGRVLRAETRRRTCTLARQPLL